MNATSPSVEPQPAPSSSEDGLLDPRHVPLGPAYSVRRVNSLPLLIIVVGLVTFCLLIALALLDRTSTSRRTVAATQGPTAPTNEVSKTPGSPAVLSQAPAGIIEAQVHETPPATADGPMPERAVAVAPGGLKSPGAPPQEQDPHQVPAPAGPFPVKLPADPTVEHERALRALDERLRLFAERAKASSVVPFRTETSATALSATALVTQDDITSRLAEIRRTLEQSSSEDPPAIARARQQWADAPLPVSAATASPTSVTEVTESGQESPNAKRWRLTAGWETPRSAYELRAGSVIPALTLTTIRSELPGQVMAQVSADVYDTATGRHRVIPQGTRLIGRYASDVMYGQKTLFVAWQRLIRPDGAALDLGSMPAAQAAGAAGLSDEVNNHYFRLFGSALLLSGVTAGIAYSTTPAQGTGPSDGTRMTARESLSEALGQQLGQVTAQLLVKNMNVSPTLEIRPGYRFVVLVTKDIDLAPTTHPDTARR